MVFCHAALIWRVAALEEIGQSTGATILDSLF